MIIDCGSYRIVPYPGNTCWCIQKRVKNPNAKSQWNKPRYYPSSITHAVKHVMELQMKELDEDLSVTEAVAEIQKIADDLLEAVAKAVGEDASKFVSVEEIESAEDDIDGGVGEIVGDEDAEAEEG